MNIRRLAICLSAAALALPSLAAADETPANSSIIAMGHARHGWLAASGPDAAGIYRVSVRVADLDPATEAGWSAMATRAERGTLALCDMASEGMQVRGYSNKGRQRCLREAGDLADKQMTQAREARLQGRPVAMLGMATVAAAR